MRILVVAASVLWLGPLASPALSQDRLQQSAPLHQVPPAESLLMMIRTLLAALHHANFTGNYTVLHSLAAPAFQAKTSPADLGIAFTELRKLNVDMSAALIVSPELTEQPGVTQDGRLRLIGQVPTAPLALVFEMYFRPVDNVWRYDTLSVGVRPAKPASPAASAAPAPAAPVGAPASQAKRPATPTAKGAPAGSSGGAAAK